MSETKRMSIVNRYIIDPSLRVSPPKLGLRPHSPAEVKTKTTDVEQFSYLSGNNNRATTCVIKKTL